MRFRYQAYDSGGQPRAGVIESADEGEARESLRRDGLFVSVIAEAGAAPSAERVARARRSAGSLRALTDFARHFSVLIKSGTPVVEALGALERQARDARWAAIVGDVRARVEEGQSLAESMAAHPRAFDSVARSLVAAGESGGRLDVMLERLATLVQQQLRVRRALVGALVYPVLLIGVASTVLVLMMLFVLPRFAELFRTLQLPLPPTTEVLVTMSDLLRLYWWAMLLAIGGGIGGGVAWVRSAEGRRWLHGALVRLPQIGRVTRSFATARLARVLGVLLESRVPLLDSIDLTRASSTNLLYAELLGRAKDSVTRGEPLSAVLLESPLIDASLSEAVRNAERSGKTGPVLMSVADFLDEQNETTVRALTSILEPVILIVLGVLVGLVAISMFMPLFDLTAQTGGGQ